ncbi:carboxymuconolactone decarboxylase family protein [Corynebacterium urogenitale]
MTTNKKSHPYLDKTNPEVFKAMNEAAKQSQKAGEQAGLSRALLELLDVRVSQLNGCPTCLSVHVPAAEQAGVDPMKIAALPSWRHAEIFSDEERVALGLAESLTVHSGASHVLNGDRFDDDDAKAVETFSEEQLAALQWAIITINSFNRISIASQHPMRRPKA